MHFEPRDPQYASLLLVGLGQSIELKSRVHAQNAVMCIAIVDPQTLGSTVPWVDCC